MVVSKHPDRHIAEFLPFLLDSSRAARQIRRIGTPQLETDDLDALLELVETSKGATPFRYLWQIWHRAEAALASCDDPDLTERLDRLMRMAQFEAQSVTRA